MRTARSCSSSGSPTPRVCLPALKPDETVELDGSSVGVTAEVSVNDAKAGERVWRPYRFDINGQVRSGKNALKVIVAIATLCLTPA